MMMLSLRNGLLDVHNSVNQKYNMIYNFEHSIVVYQYILLDEFEESYETQGMDMLDTVREVVSELLNDKQQKSTWNALWDCIDENMSLRNCIRITEKFLSGEVVYMVVLGHI